MLMISDLSEDDVLIFVNETVDIFNNTVYQSYELKIDGPSYLIKFNKRINKKTSIENEYRTTELKITLINKDAQNYSINGVTEEGFKFAFDNVIYYKIEKDIPNDRGGNYTK